MGEGVAPDFWWKTLIMWGFAFLLVYFAIV